MGSFKLGKMTLGGLFKKPETLMYPVETKTPPAGLKGHVVNLSLIHISEPTRRS